MNQANYIILNDPASNLTPTLAPCPKELISSSKFLPLTEEAHHPPLLRTRSRKHSLNRHPTYLLCNFPQRPHFYQPNTVGAQAGYCLSPQLPSLAGSTITTISPLVFRYKSYKLASPCPPTRSQDPISSSSSPSPSNTVASSDSSNSDSSFSFSASGTAGSKTTNLTSLSIPKTCQSSRPAHSELFHSSFDENNPCFAVSMSMTKKVLPTPPSLSNRVRQIFASKTNNSQQAESCAQLPRRKKRPVVVETTVEPVA